MTRRSKKVRYYKVNASGKITGRHYDHIIQDDLLGGPTATNVDPKAWPQDQQLTLKTIQETIEKFWKALPSPPKYIIVSPWAKSALDDWLRERNKWSKEEMAKQVELYRNVIETKYGVKLCVKDNRGSDVTSMELIVPNKLFHDEEGRQALADAFQNIAMFVMSMDDEES